MSEPSEQPLYLGELVEGEPSTPEASAADDAVVACSPAAGELVAQPRALPHPHFGWALLWVLMFWGVQFLAGVPLAFAVVAHSMWQGQQAPEQINLALDQATIWMVPLGTFVSVLWAVAVAGVLYGRAFRERLALRGMTGTQWLLTFLLVLPLAVLASEVTNCASDLKHWLLERLPALSSVLSEFNLEILAEFSQLPWPLVLVSACLFPAVGEEIYCRGFLGRGLVANHGVVKGVLLSSLLFGVMHLEPIQSIGAFALGLGLHYVYLTTRSLLAPMLIHLLNNAFAFWTFRSFESFPIPGVTPMPDGSAVHTPLPLLLTSLLAGGFICWLLYQGRTRWMLPDETEWSPGYPTAEEPPPHQLAMPVFRDTSRAALLTCLVLYAALLGALWLAHRQIALQ